MLAVILSKIADMSVCVSRLLITCTDTFSFAVQIGNNQWANKLGHLSSSNKSQLNERWNCWRWGFKQVIEDSRPEHYVLFTLKFPSKWGKIWKCFPFIWPHKSDSMQTAHILQFRLNGKQEQYRYGEKNFKTFSWISFQSQERQKAVTTLTLKGFLCPLG